MAINFSNYSSWDMPLFMNRTNPVPLDKTSVFNTLAEAESYASTSGVAYDGQFLAVVEDGVVKTYVIENKALKEIGSSKAAADSLEDAVDKMSSDNVGDIIYVTEDTYVYEDENGKKVYVADVTDLPADKVFDEDSADEYNELHADDEGFEPVAAGDIKPDAGVDVYGPGAYIVSGDREVEKLAQSNPGSADLDSEVAALKTKVDSKLDASVLDSESTFNFAFNPDKENELLLNIGGKLASIDLAKFAIDGMLQSVVLVKEDVEGVTEKAPYFEFTWNIDTDPNVEGIQNKVMRVELGDVLDSAIADKADKSYVDELIYGKGEGDEHVDGLEDRISSVESALDANAEGSLASKVAALETGKAASDHVHDLSELTDTTNILDSKAAADHTHTIADVVGLSDKLSDAENRLAVIEDGLGVPKYYETADEYNDAHLIPDEEGNLPGAEGYVETYEDGFEPVSDEDFANLPESDKLIPSDGSFADVIFGENGLVNTVDDHSDAIEEMSSVLYGDDDDDTNNGLVGDVEGLQNVVGDSESGLVKDVTDLAGVVGDSESGLVKDVADIASDVEDLKSAVTGVFRFAGKLDEVPSLDELDEEDLESLVGSVIVVGDDEWALAAPFDDEDDYHWVNLGHDSLTDTQIDSIWDDVFSDKAHFVMNGSRVYSLNMANINGPLFKDNMIFQNQFTDADENVLMFQNVKLIDGEYIYTYPEYAPASIDDNIVVFKLRYDSANYYVKLNGEYVYAGDTIIPNANYELEEIPA